MQLRSRGALASRHRNVYADIVWSGQVTLMLRIHQTKALYWTCRYRVSGWWICSFPVYRTFYDYWEEVALGQKNNTNFVLLYQTSLSVSHKHHCLYCTNITVCITQTSLSVSYKHHCLYHTNITVCITQTPLSVSHKHHCLYHTNITVCTTQTSLSVPHKHHCLYHTNVLSFTSKCIFYLSHRECCMFSTKRDVIVYYHNTNKYTYN
jgi:hypothetical protein